MADSPLPPGTTIDGDVFTGGKRVINTGGGDYYEGVAPIGLAALHQLPPPPAGFTGRQNELAELLKTIHDTSLNGGATLAGLRGLGGVGKTALALVLAHALASDYSDAQIFLDLRGVGDHPLSPEAVMAHVIRAYQPLAKLPDDPAQLAAAYRSLLHGQRALLRFDNARDAAQIKPLLPPSRCLLLVTSRARIALPGLRPLNLDSLPPADAQALLLTLAPRIGDQAATLAQLCANLPLALTLAGRALAEREDLEPADYARRLQQTRLTLLDEVAASLALSYDLLSPELQTLWCALSVFPGGFDAPAAAAVWSLEPDPASDRLGDLLRYSLLDFNAGTRRYRVHDLARDFARSRLSDAERETAQRRHSVHYKTVIAAANKLYLQGGDDLLRALALYDRERANLLAGQAWAAGRSNSDDLAALITSDYTGTSFHVRDLRQSPLQKIAWLEAALAAARRMNDRPAEGVHLGNLGLAYAELGQLRRAIEQYEQALVLDRELGNRGGESADLANLGSAYKNLGEPGRAIEYRIRSFSLRTDVDR